MESSGVSFQMTTAAVTAKSALNAVRASTSSVPRPEQRRGKMRKPRGREEQNEEREKGLIGAAPLTSAVIDEEERRGDDEQRDGDDTVGDGVNQVEPRDHRLGLNGGILRAGEEIKQ